IDSSPVYGVRKRMPVLKRRLRYQDSKDEKRKRSTRRFKDSTLRKKSASLKPSRKKMLESPDKKSVFRAVQQHQKQHRNATQRTESKGSAQGAKKYNIMKRSSGSDEKVLGELRSIFSEDSKTGQKKTVKKREDSSVALKSGDGVSDSSKAESDEDKFKKWLLDEYYRTMALSVRQHAQEAHGHPPGHPGPAQDEEGRAASRRPVPGGVTFPFSFFRVRNKDLFV
ncbi:hypothetical protein HPB47_007749, partial [Ixodes persulcatus]